MSIEKQLPGLRSISAAVNKISKPLYVKYGVARSRILTDWELIAGQTLALYSKPLKINYYKDTNYNGTLIVEVYQGPIAMQMLYMEPIIIEKIRTYLGYNAVAKLRIVQRPKDIRPVKKYKKPANNKVLAPEMAEMLAEIKDEEVAGALLRLFQSL